MITSVTQFDKSALPTVLVVTDNPETAALWVSLFQEKGCIVTSETPVFAIQTGSVLAPRLVLVDVKTPHAARLALCRGLKAVSRGALLMLVPSDYQQIVESYAEGADECIVRPMNAALVLVKAMAWMLRQQLVNHNYSVIESFA